MKIRGNNFDKLHAALSAVIKEKGDLSRKYKEHGLSYKRFCWDLFYASKFRVGDGIGITGDINIKGCNDSHIETAIKSSLNKQGINSY